MNNIFEHGHASNVGVSVGRLGRQLVFSIENKGVGLDVGKAEPVDGRQPTQMRLLGMRKRIEVLGDTFAIESRAGKGTTVLLQVPLH